MDLILSLLEQYRILAVFAGSFFFGDSVIITAAYLAGQLDWAVAPIFIAAVLGTIIADTLWFVVGVFLKRSHSHFAYFEKQREQAAAFLHKLTGTRPEMALIYIKFLYGTRIAMILYAAARGMSIKTFTIYNSLGVLLWFIIFFPLGYLAGRGIARAMPLVGTVEAALVVLVASFVAVRIFNIWLTHRMEKK